ncbi:MAG: TRAP transporter substrate-binding protein [Rhodospirillaceae bacterium]|nr:TRAP transporter substrate-binding protein [Rhodospirillaceae bacterium]
MIVPALTRIAALLSIAATLLSGVANAADGRVASAAPKDTVWDKQWGQWKQAAEANNFKFEYFVNGELGGENEITSAVRRNRIQVAGVSSAALSAVIPEVSVTFAPYLFRSADEADFVYDKYLMPVLREIAAGYGLHLMEWGEVGLSHMYATKPLREPADVKGMRLRGPMNIAHQAFLRAIGADAVALGLPDIVPSLQTGMINGGMANIVLHTATTATFAKNYTLTGHIYDTNFFFTNLDWYKKLPADRQKALNGLIVDPLAARKEVRAMSDALVAALKQRPDTTVITLTEDQLAKWRAAASPAAKEIVAQSGPRAQEVLDAINKGLAAYRAQQPAAK